ncbi:hypothetical protein ACFSKL_18610 [Belliella marina]|uniref:WD40-like Beta Propeller Repeat n=1 Tax=Belliella marina TaxID=1644146 RepID=A0ABW4VRG8_9BACT
MKKNSKITLCLACLCLQLTNVLAQEIQRVEIAHDKLNEFVNLRDFCISSANDEIYFTIQSPFQEISQIAYMKKTNGEWTSPELMAFSNKFSDLEPFLSPDQTKLYFASNRPLNDTSNTEKDYDIWYIERADKQSPWSIPINLGEPINTGQDEFYPSVSKNGNLYFTLDSPSGMGKDDIYFSEFKDGIYLQPHLLDSAINSPGYEFNAFVSKNEDFLIFTKYNSEDGFGSGDLYISTKDINNNWTQAENLGSGINTKFMEYCPFYDEENEILYFTSRRNNIEKRTFENFESLKSYLTESENGLSKIYKVKYKVNKPER